VKRVATTPNETRLQNNAIADEHRFAFFVCLNQIVTGVINSPSVNLNFLYWLYRNLSSCFIAASWTALRGTTLRAIIDTH